MERESDRIKLQKGNVCFPTVGPFPTKPMKVIIKSPGVFLGTTPKGEEKKLANGEKENGPTMWPANHFLSSFADKTSGCSSARRKFRR